MLEGVRSGGVADEDAALLFTAMPFAAFVLAFVRAILAFVLAFVPALAFVLVVLAAT